MKDFFMLGFGSSRNTRKATAGPVALPKGTGNTEDNPVMKKPPAPQDNPGSDSTQLGTEIAASNEAGTLSEEENDVLGEIPHPGTRKMHSWQQGSSSFDSTAFSPRNFSSSIGKQGIQSAASPLGNSLRAFNHVPTSAQDKRLSQQDIEANHAWLRSLKEITVGFNFEAPGSGHIGASKAVLKKVAAIVPESTSIHIAADKPFPDEFVRELKQELQGRDIKVHGFNLRRAQNSLMIFGALDNATHPGTLWQFGYVSSNVLVVQPPYFDNSKPILFRKGECVPIPDITPRHIFTATDTPLQATSIDTTPLLNTVNDLAKGGNEIAIFYDGGVGTGNNLQRMLNQLGKTSSPATCVLISNRLSNALNGDIRVLEKGDHAIEVTTNAHQSYSEKLRVPDNVKVIVSGKLPPAEFQELIQHCTLPSLLGGALSANDFQVAGKPWLIANSKTYFDDAYSLHRPYSDINGLIDYEGVYQSYKEGKFDDFFGKMNEYTDITRDRFELAVAFTRENLSFQ